MRSTVFIPKKIRVGFQKRDDTYTGKLAYITYFDEKGVLRKETSWNNWRDKDIDYIDFDNNPIEGYVLNKKVGDYSGYWSGHRSAKIRVYSQNDYEFEISVENLLFILENATSSKGKGLEGEFVLGWDSKDIVLLPCESAEYQELIKFNESIHSGYKLGARAVKVGATYLTRDNNEWTYLGKFYHQNSHWDSYFPNGEKTHSFTKEEKPSHVFCSKNSDGNYSVHYEKSNWRKFIACLDEECHPDYADMFYYLEGRSSYSPIDISKTEYKPFDKEEFIAYCLNNWSDWQWSKVKFTTNQTGHFQKIELGRHDSENNTKPYIELKIKIKEEYIPSYSWSRKTQIREVEREVRINFKDLEEIFDKFKPMYQVSYLKNGRIHREDN